MGTKVYGSVSISRLVQSSDKEALIREAVLAYIMKGESLIDGLIAASRGNKFDERAEAFYEYGKDNYVRGLPEGQVTYNIVDQAALTAVLEALEGEPIILTFAVSGPLLTDAIITSWLVANMGYNPGTGKVDSFRLAQFNPFPILFNGLAYDNLYTIRGMWITGWTVVGSIVTFSYTYNYSYWYLDEYRGYTVRGSDNGVVGFPFPYDVVLVDGVDDFLDVRYKLASDPNGEDIVFTYLLGSGQYPTLDPDESIVGESPYFPIVPIRSDRVSMAVNPGTEPYDSTQGMLKTLGMDVGELLGAVEQSPDLEFVEDVFVTMAVDVHSDTPEVISYFFDYWEAIGLANIGATDEVSFFLLLTLSPGTFNAPRTTKLKIIEDGFSTTIAYNFITQWEEAGNIGPVGTIDKLFNSQPDFTWSLQYYEDPNWENANNPQQSTFIGKVPMSFIIYTKQIDATTVKKIKVHGLTHSSLLDGFKEYFRTLDTALGSESFGFFIPVAKDIADRIPNKSQRSIFYSEACILVVYALQYVHTAWYQSGIFKFLLTIVAVVITIASLGSAIVAAEGILAVATVLATAALKAVIFSYAFELLVNMVGGELALILAVAAAAAGLAGGEALGSINGVPWAEILMNAANGIMAGIDLSVKHGLEDLRDESDIFFEDAEKRQQALDDAYDMLGDGSIDPAMLLREAVNQYINEGPSEFYDRTIHITNPGVLSLTGASLYVDSALTLPTLDKLF